MAGTVVSVAGAASRAASDKQVILAGLTHAAASGRVPSDEAAAYRKLVRRAWRIWPRLPGTRAAPLREVLHDVAAQAGRYTAPRARALFGMLDANVDYLSLHAPTGAAHQEITDADGVVYRWFAGHGFQFHPLGNFGALNGAVNAGDEDGIRRLADALAARGVSAGPGGLVWEYYFPFGGGRAPWTSGMAQAVAAQAFARASAKLGDPRLAYVARRAERAIPGRLERTTSFGTWIRLYSFSSVVVLNAQLQSALSLATYARITEDDDAAALAEGLRNAAANGLPSFDTGFWSLYALPAEVSPLSYHEYVVSLLQALARSDPRFAPAASRFVEYTKQPPAFQLADSGGDGVLFWLSKPSTVSVRIGSAARTLGLGGGWHRVTLPVGKEAGAYWTRIAATDYAGNRAAADALPVVRAALARTARRTLGGAVAAPPSFAVGAGIDSPEQARAAVAAGLDTVRVVVSWQPGEVAPRPDVVAALNSLTARRLVVQLAYAVPDVSLAPFTASLVEQVPRIADVIVGAPGQPAAAYVATLAAVYDAVRAKGSAASVAGTIADAPSIAALGTAFAAGGRTKPIMDELAFRSATEPDYGKVVSALAAAFDRGAQPGSALPLLWDGIGTATKIPRAKAPVYAPDAAAAAGVTERAQADAYLSVLQHAACAPTGAGVLLNRLADAPTLGAQDGLLYADGTPKGSLALLAPRLAQARRGTLAVCPGVAAKVATTALTFPNAESYPASNRDWSLQLACSRDCLYLVTLDRAATGVPMLARRGSLAAGRPPATIALPRVRVPAGTYRLTLRLVSRVNPGPLLLRRGPVFTVS